ncbi:DUF1850 domain-containing protein [Pelagibacterium halotolerans]|uniref:DUF1850 domain-containing protein n=1 Tax=Pelagibacterium halotolerans TaxID=531813 RepID=UPI00384B4E27
MSEPLCILAAGKVLVLAVSTFTLSWTHTVERIEWWEHWQVLDNGLKVTEARVQGSGAGIDLPGDAVRTADGWLYEPALPPVEHLVLAASGAGQSAWRLCGDGQCLTLGEESGDPIKLWRAEGGVCDANSVTP